MRLAHERRLSHERRQSGPPPLTNVMWSELAHHYRSHEEDALPNSEEWKASECFRLGLPVPW